ITSLQPLSQPSNASVYFLQLAGQRFDPRCHPVGATSRAPRVLSTHLLLPRDCPRGAESPAPLEALLDLSRMQICYCRPALLVPHENQKDGGSDHPHSPRDITRRTSVARSARSE